MPLTCDQPTRFQVEAICVDNLTAIATPAGLGVFAIDSLGTLSGWSFDVAGGTALVQNRAIDVGMSTASVGAVAIGDQVVVTAIHDSNGTTVYPVGLDGSSRGPNVAHPGSAGPSRSRRMPRRSHWSR